jgi:hypothetical protein
MRRTSGTALWEHLNGLMPSILGYGFSGHHGYPTAESPLNAHATASRVEHTG